MFQCAPVTLPRGGKMRLRLWGGQEFQWSFFLFRFWVKNGYGIVDAFMLNRPLIMKDELHKSEAEIVEIAQKKQGIMKAHVTPPTSSFNSLVSCIIHLMQAKELTCVFGSGIEIYPILECGILFGFQRLDLVDTFLQMVKDGHIIEVGVNASNNMKQYKLITKYEESQCIYDYFKQNNGKLARLDDQPPILPDEEAMLDNERMLDNEEMSNNNETDNDISLV